MAAAVDDIIEALLLLILAFFHVPVSTLGYFRIAPKNLFMDSLIYLTITLNFSVSPSSLTERTILLKWTLPLSN